MHASTNTSHPLRLGLLLGAAMLAATGTAAAREPGAPYAYAPGSSLGIPAGANPPPGFWLEDTSGITEVQNTDPFMSAVNGAKVTAVVTAPRFIWSLPGNFHGVTEMGFVVFPMVNTSVSNLPPPNPKGTFTKAAFANPGITPINLSWSPAPNLFITTAFGFFPPVGQYSKTSLVNVGNNFWTIQPETSISYLGNGYNLTAHALYDFNTKNNATDYTSGDQLFLDLTAAKHFGKWEAGAVGFYDTQFTSDSNTGNFYGPGHPTFGAPHEIAMGALLAYDFGPLTATGYFTRTLTASDSGADGTSVSLRLFFPL
ncbi:SphA family protein [Acidocella aminolytica]|uniref:MetA pathway phenol degradation-like protein n=1 Tax=Acidocella aminolytica 101 = DSM 11237 TaxID=1120923 RepID=A0A0D6PJR3_9PROT|nr:transporter [Acidocella aminolytica]GAN81443.1 metA pathway phenol degradation-like protein [Acidocella aminolytica 101 = DSM 11237]GBQ41851.1 hypothetical protein AA11237_2805 [Acidocella aminolytica 101 = DSM 11237]SHF01594.1 Uncharacterized conserved protein [Acidocella aminolytica 101 = DSM 11237]